MEYNKFLIGLREVLDQLSDLLTESEEKQFLFHDKKVFKLLSKSYVPLNVAFSVKLNGDLKMDENGDDEIEIEDEV